VEVPEIPWVKQQRTGSLNGSVLPEQTVSQSPTGDLLVTRARLALVLGVSLRTLDMMLADGDITPMRLRGKLVRFYLPDVLQELREKAKTSKRNVARKI
jgi:hypothetical protein